MVNEKMQHSFIVRETTPTKLDNLHIHRFLLNIVLTRKLKLYYAPNSLIPKSQRSIVHVTRTSQRSIVHVTRTSQRSIAHVTRNKEITCCVIQRDLDNELIKAFIYKKNFYFHPAVT